MLDEIKLVVRIMPNSDEVEVTLPSDTKCKELRDYLIQNQELKIPSLDAQNNPIVYQIIVKGRNEVLPEGDTFAQHLVEDGDLLLMIPKVIAG